MTCRHCGHLNPQENRFCGMCGHLLVPGSKSPERVSEPAAPPPIMRQAEPPPKPEPAGAPLTGPSFLGLSSDPDAGESGGYSYLFQDEPQSSHKGLYVFLLLLVIGGGIAYARWQPIRQYVVSNVIPRLRQQTGTAPQPPPPAPVADQATISVASNPPEQKASETAPASQPSAAPEPQKPMPQADSGHSADVNKAEAKTAVDKEAPAAKTKSEAATADADAADEDAPESIPAARHTRPQPPAGDALVNTGEKYLYGRGVRKNCNQAVTYFRAAAEQQNPRALSRLGTMYAIGECVPLDRAVAYSWFGRALALDRSNRSLERNMSMLWREMSPEERQRAGGR